MRVSWGREVQDGRKLTLSALPVTTRCSLAGLNARERISRSCAWTFELGSLGDLVSQLDKQPLAQSVSWLGMINRALTS